MNFITPIYLWGKIDPIAQSSAKKLKIHNTAVQNISDLSCLMCVRTCVRSSNIYDKKGLFSQVLGHFTFLSEKDRQHNEEAGALNCKGGYPAHFIPWRDISTFHCNPLSLEP